MITLILIIALMGLVVWAVTTYVPMPPPFKTAIYVVAVILLVLYIMQVFGIGDIPVRSLGRG